MCEDDYSEAGREQPAQHSYLKTYQRNERERAKQRTSKATSDKRTGKKGFLLFYEVGENLHDKGKKEYLRSVRAFC